MAPRADDHGNRAAPARRGDDPADILAIRQLLALLAIIYRSAKQA
jgi:hypothetical protein